MRTFQQSTKVQSLNRNLFFSIGQFQRKKHLMVIWNNSTVFNAEQLVKGQDSRMDHNFLKETHTQKKRDWFGMTSSLY